MNREGDIAKSEKRLAELEQAMDTVYINWRKDYTIKAPDKQSAPQ